MHSNFNFISHAAALGFLGAAGGTLVTIAVTALALVLRKRGLARAMLAVWAAGAALYVVLLLGFSLASHEDTVARGGEKYFCEADCHLAYSVVGVETARTIGAGASQRTATGTFYVVSLRTRFDETTTSLRRPKDATLHPNPRRLVLVADDGASYAPSSEGQAALEAAGGQGTPLDKPLLPGESYITRLVFDAPAGLSNPRLLLLLDDFVTHFMIGEENSFLHKKTYLRLLPG